MITLDDIKWGSYLGYEGPWWPGKEKYVLPYDPSFDQICLAIVASTEGSAYDAVNMYDSCGISLGLIQWCEFGQFSVSNLLGYIVASEQEFPEVVRLPSHLDKLHSFLRSINASAGFTIGNKYRFRYKNQWVIDRELQQEMFFLNATGEKGTWDTESKIRAKSWAVAVASLFENEACRRAQEKFTIGRLHNFIMPATKAFMDNELVDDLWRRTRNAAYISFAANNPSIANKMFQEYVKETPYLYGTKDWSIGLLQKLTFGPGISIYPGRYDKIRPLLEKYFGVDLPDFADELAKWNLVAGIHDDDPAEIRLDTTEGVQGALLRLGYDLGPRKIDGVYGKKTKQAVLMFQQQNGLTPTGLIDPLTRQVLSNIIEHRGL
jgi:hypothetical protein